MDLITLKKPSYYRAVKMRAAQTGNHQAAADAEIGLRATRIAKAIEKGDGRPALPPDVAAHLCRMLLAGAA